MTEAADTVAPRPRSILRLLLIGGVVVVLVVLGLRGLAKRELTRDSTLAVGAVAPDFTLPDQTGANVTLSEVLAKNRGAIVAFYPKDFTPG